MSFFNLLFSEQLSQNKRVVISGDSTLAAFACRTDTIASHLFTSDEQTDGKTAVNIAVPGHTINQQLATWNTLSYAVKKSFDFIIIQIGLNDIYNTAITQCISNLQNYVNTVNSSKKTGAKIILSCMLPCKQRWIALNTPGFDPYLQNDPVVTQQNWIDLNKSIMNQNTSLPNITGVDFRNNYHVSLMDDGNGNLKPAYDCGDYIHENQAGADIIIQGFRGYLN